MSGFFLRNFHPYLPCEQVLHEPFFELHEFVAVCFLIIRIQYPTRSMPTPGNHNIIGPVIGPHM